MIGENLSTENFEVRDEESYVASTSNEIENLSTISSSSPMRHTDVSSPKEIFKSKELSHSAPPHPRKGLFPKSSITFHTFLLLVYNLTYIILF